MFNFSKSQMIVAFIVAISALVATGMMIAKPKSAIEPIAEIEIVEPEGTQISEEESAPSSIYIHVAGSVINPGLYELEPENRVNEAIEAAGGVASDADLDSVNLAQRLEDGQQVYIAKKGEIPPPAKSVVRGGSGSPTSNSAGFSDSGTSSRPSKLSVPGEGTVNINTADLAELQRLPGIGPAYAQRILDYRNENGSFRSVDELVEVRGIGPATLEKLKPFVTL